MPRTNIDYSNTSIYKLCCKDINITDVYVGHTVCMRRRKNHHKTSCNNDKSKNYNSNVYQFIRENGGWDNWSMIEIEKYNAINGYDATKRERYWIEELKATLNCNIPSRIYKEYYEDNIEKILEYQKEYRENNKEIIAEQRKEYRENNKEIITERKKEFYENNKEKILEYQKEKIICECGCIISRGNLAIHKKKKKHIDLISKIIDPL